MNKNIKFCVGHRDELGSIKTRGLINIRNSVTPHAEPKKRNQIGAELLKDFHR